MRIRARAKRLFPDCLAQVFNMDLVMASVLLLAAAAVLMYRLVLLAEIGFNHLWG